MPKGFPLLITVKHASGARRFWRELYALIQWGLQHSIYASHRCPFAANVLGHEGFSVQGRKNADEIELVIFGGTKGPLEQRWSSPELRKMHREMLEALEEVASKYGYTTYSRERKRSSFSSL